MESRMADQDCIHRPQCLTQGSNPPSARASNLTRIPAPITPHNHDLRTSARAAWRLHHSTARKRADSDFGPGPGLACTLPDAPGPPAGPAGSRAGTAAVGPGPAPPDRLPAG